MAVLGRRDRSVFTACCRSRDEREQRHHACIASAQQCKGCPWTHQQSRASLGSRLALWKRHLQRATRFVSHAPLGRNSFATHSQAHRAVSEYIDQFFNPIRRHSTNGYLSPIMFELCWQTHQLTVESTCPRNCGQAHLESARESGLTCIEGQTLVLRSPYNAKSVATVDAARGADRAVRHTAAERPVDPTPTAQHFGVSSHGSCGVGHASRCIGSIPILAPLTNIARHVVQAKRVRRLAPNGMRFAACVGVVPSNIHKQAVGVGAVRISRHAVKRCCCPSAIGIFPLSLRWKAEPILGAEDQNHVPRDIFDRTRWTVRGSRKVTWIASHFRQPLRLSYFMATKIERAQSDLVRWGFIQKDAVHVRCAVTHRESSRRNQQHLDTCDCVLHTGLPQAQQTLLTRTTRALALKAELLGHEALCGTDVPSEI